MVRIGKLTGNKYDETVDVSSIGECCRMCNTDEEVELALKEETRARDNVECSLCRGCPEYWRE